jgi:hypothetical protein
VSLEVEIEAVDGPPLSSEQVEAPEPAELLSPAARDEQLAMLQGSEPGDEELEIVDSAIAGVSVRRVLANAAQLLAEPRASDARERSSL